MCGDARHQPGGRVDVDPRRQRSVGDPVVEGLAAAAAASERQLEGAADPAAHGGAIVHRSDLNRVASRTAGAGRIGDADGEAERAGLGRLSRQPAVRRQRYSGRQRTARHAPTKGRGSGRRKHDRLAAVGAGSRDQGRVGRASHRGGQAVGRNRELRERGERGQRRQNRQAWQKSLHRHRVLFDTRPTANGIGSPPGRLSLAGAPPAGRRAATARPPRARGCAPYTLCRAAAETR